MSFPLDSVDYFSKSTGTADGACPEVAKSLSIDCFQKVSSRIEDLLDGKSSAEPDMRFIGSPPPKPAPAAAINTTKQKDLPPPSWPLPEESVAERLSDHSDWLVRRQVQFSGFVQNAARPMYFHEQNKLPDIFKKNPGLVDQVWDFYIRDVQGQFGRSRLSSMDLPGRMESKAAKYQKWFTQASDTMMNGFRFFDVSKEFSAVDADGNGFINKAELSKKYEPTQYASLHKAFDSLLEGQPRSANGLSKAVIQDYVVRSVNATDTSDVLWTYAKYLGNDDFQGRFSDRVVSRFRMWDTDSNGGLDRGELEAVQKNSESTDGDKAVASVIERNYEEFRRLNFPPIGAVIWWPWPQHFTKTLTLQNIYSAANGRYLSYSPLSPYSSREDSKKILLDILDLNLLP